MPTLLERVSRDRPVNPPEKFISGLGPRIVFDLDRLDVGEGQHVLARVRSRQLWPDARLELVGPATRPPVFLRRLPVLGGFEWLYALQQLPAGTHTVRFSGGAPPRPVAATWLFVHPDPQPGGLLTNGSFEDGQGSPPAGWTAWADSSGGMGAPAVGYRSLASGDPRVTHLGQAVTFASGHSIHRGGVRQAVQVGAGKSNCTAEVSVSVLTWDQQQPSWTEEQCGGGAFKARLGLDPQGGTDPEAASVRWAETWAACPDFKRLTVRAPVAGARVSVFLESAPKWPVVLNLSTWDGARLSLDCP